MKRNWLVLLIALLAVILVSIPVYSAPPPEPPGLDKAFAAQERHQDVLLNVAGVAGVAVGLNESNQAQVIIFTETAGVRGLPPALDGVPVKTVVSGKFEALARSSKAPSKPTRNTAPVVTIISPADGAVYVTGATINFSGTAFDKEQGDLSGNLLWQSDGVKLATGASFSIVLPDGKHTITASVTDSGNKTGSSSITVTVGASHSAWWYARPVPIGVSTGHPDITAGTIGARVKIGSNFYALSNNHVYADENHASIGDNVLQPGPYDGGTNPADAIGTLSSFKTIIFSRLASNTIDAAIALSSDTNLGNSTPAGAYGTPRSTTIVASVGMPVQKYGRTTKLTTGQVYAINATVNVGYSSGTARFVNQIVITPGTFSAGGDSGSLIVVNKPSTGDNVKPVGLLFAGSSSYTIANPIDAVLNNFGATIDGSP